MTDSEQCDRGAELVTWAQAARVRSAAYAAQAQVAAESAAEMGAQADRMIERAAERCPEHAEHLQAIIVTAASKRAAIAEGQRDRAAGRPGVPLELATVSKWAAAGAELQDAVIQQVFAAGLTLQDAAGLTAEPEVRWRIEAVVGDLDELIRLVRDMLFSGPGR
jgi:hypothetical protein